MFRLILEGLGSDLKNTIPHNGKNKGKVGANVYAIFTKKVLLLGDIKGILKPQKTVDNFLRRKLDPESNGKDVSNSFQRQLVHTIVSNIKNNRESMVAKLCDYENGIMTSAIEALIEFLYKNVRFSALMKDTEYPKSKLRFLVDSMESCIIANDCNDEEVTLLAIYNKLLDFILFALETTAIGETTSNARLLSEKIIPDSATLNDDEKKVIYMLNSFENKIARMKYTIFCENERILKKSTLNLLKQGIIFLSKEKILTLSPAYWSGNCEVEWKMRVKIRTNLVEELYSELKDKSWNSDSFREDLIAAAPSIKELQFFLRDKLLVLLREQCRSVWKIGTINIENLIKIQDCLLHTEIVLLFAGMSKAREKKDKEMFVNIFENFTHLLEKHPGTKKELQQPWENLKKELSMQERAVSE
jgi:hypothetical protein